MKAILATLITATALAVSLSHGKEDNAAGQASGGGDYLMVAGGATCAISGAADGLGPKRVHFGSGCDAAGVSTGATHIVARDDGSVDLLTSRGEPVIRFAAAEGGTHVSYEPHSPLIQLIAVE